MSAVEFGTKSAVGGRPTNLMPQVARLLGVDMGAKFFVDRQPSGWMLLNDGLHILSCKDAPCGTSCQTLANLLVGKSRITARESDVKDGDTVWYWNDALGTTVSFVYRANNEKAVALNDEGLLFHTEKAAEVLGQKPQQPLPKEVIGTKTDSDTQIHDRLLSYSEVANIFSIGLSTIRKWVATREVECVALLNKEHRITESSLLNYIKRHAIRASKETFTKSVHEQKWVSTKIFKEALGFLPNKINRMVKLGDFTVLTIDRRFRIPETQALAYIQARLQKDKEFKLRFKESGINA